MNELKNLLVLMKNICNRSKPVCLDPTKYQHGYVIVSLNNNFTLLFQVTYILISGR